jgi:hypothetical protein
MDQPASGPSFSPPELPLQQQDYEILVLLAVEYLGGEAKREEVLHLMEAEMMPDILARYPGEQTDRRSGEIVWRNKASFARKDLKARGLLSMPAHGIWAITEAGTKHLREMLPSFLSVRELRKYPVEKRRAAYAKVVEILRERRDFVETFTERCKKVIHPALVGVMNRNTPGWLEVVAVFRGGMDPDPHSFSGLNNWRVTLQIPNLADLSFVAWNPDVKIIRRHNGEDDEGLGLYPLHEITPQFVEDIGAQFLRSLRR